MSRLVVGTGVLIACAAASPALGQQAVDLDLAGSTSMTLPAPGTPVKLRVINRIPSLDYSVVVENRLIAIAALDPLEQGTKLAGSTACDAELSTAKKLSTSPPKSEREVKTIADGVRANLEAGICSDSKTVQEINLALARTVLDIQGNFAVTEGHEVVLTISRKEGDKTLTWRLTVQGESRGKWLTTFGLAFVPDKDKKYFTKGTGATGGAPFAIMPEQELGGFKPMPSVFFTWIARSRQDKNWAVGPGAGFGLEGGSRPAVFAGLNVTYNWNIGFVGGVAMVPEMRLKGRYSEATPPQTVNEDIDAASLHTSVVAARAFFALTFRFGSNPFKAPATPKPSGS